MLKESTLYTFLDHKQNMLWHFLEAQKLIADLSQIHIKRSSEFLFFRDILLSTQPLIALLKSKEGLGLYVDSDVPYFRFKIETNEAGLTRTLLLPDDLPDNIRTVSGNIRLVKLFPNNSRPYTSVVTVNNEKTSNLINILLKDSYQLDGEIFLSESVDQSLLIFRLPTPIGHPHLEQELSSKEYYLLKRTEIDEILNTSFEEISQIEELFAKHGLRFLKKSTVKFFCPCSKEQMITNILKLSANDMSTLFENGEDSLTVQCDYCKTQYMISKTDIGEGGFYQ